MPALQGGCRLDEITLKWRRLADRRLAYYTELYRSGRWARYYTKERFAVRMLDVIRAAKLWRDLAERTSARRRPAGRDFAASGRARGDDLRPAA